MNILFKAFYIEDCLSWCEVNQEKHPNVLIEMDIFSGMFQVINLGGKP
tara:strand:+ start:323 stop:466 length:144 start_codon:yes stop_codon:yes gene_type:complete